MTQWYKQIGLAGCFGAALWTMIAATPSVPAGANENRDRFVHVVRPLIAKYCSECHSEDNPEGGLELTSFATASSLLENLKPWHKALRKLRAGQMPPIDAPQPTQAERTQLIESLRSTLMDLESREPRNPGRVTIRRLNRVEYRNTVRDLFGIEFRPAADFPADEVGYGFDNIADVLSISPLLMEKYLAAAESIAHQALAADAQRPTGERRILGLPAGSDAKSPSGIRSLLTTFVSKAYRRPAQPDEVDRLMHLVKSALQEGDGPKAAIELAVQAVLVSPSFLFRIERDPKPTNAQTVRTLDDFELATRLSYFLWSTMPDDELFALAKAGTLRANLAEQVRRMLATPKAQALVTNFASQWLQLRGLQSITPDRQRFPRFDERLRQAMRQETEAFVAHVVRNDRSVVELLDADYTFLNERLARHYGIDGVKGDEFRLVKLTTDQRGGLLSQASILTLTSNPTRTSPVKRGKWVLEQILGSPPPPPPPDVPPLDESAGPEAAFSLRERLEQHRADPNCAVCHHQMDTLGFGLENYDAVGAWRERDGKVPIDPSGTLPDGRAFRQPAELRAALARRRVEFVRCLVEKLLVYALGRGLMYDDDYAVERIVESAARNDYRFSGLVLGIVESDPFQKRAGAGGAK